MDEAGYSQVKILKTMTPGFELILLTHKCLSLEHG